MNGSNFAKAEFARQNDAADIEIGQFGVSALPEPGALGAQMKGDSAFAPANQGGNADVLNNQRVRLQYFVKIERFFEKFEFMIKNDGVEGYIQLLAESLGNTSGPAQSLFIKIAGKGAGAKPLPGQIYGIGSRQTGGFKAGSGACRRQQFNFCRCFSQRLFPFDKPFQRNPVDVGAEPHDDPFTDWAEQ
jgi:hypothetical protein